jgi:hypothetical protein
MRSRRRARASEPQPEVDTCGNAAAGDAIEIDEDARIDRRGDEQRKRREAQPVPGGPIAL